MKIEVGKTYVDEDGEKYGPMVIWLEGATMPYSTKPGYEIAPTFAEDGIGYSNRKKIRLVREFVEPAVEPAASGLQLKEGRYYRDENGNVGGAAFVWDSSVQHPFQIDKPDNQGGFDTDCTLYRPDGTSAYGTDLVCEVAPPDFRLEVGDHVRLADGSVVGPMRRDNRAGFRHKDLFVVDGVFTPGGGSGALQIWKGDGTIFGCASSEKLLHAVEKVEKPADAAKIESLTIKFDAADIRDLLAGAESELDKALSQLADKDAELRAAKDAFNVLFAEKENLKWNNDRRRQAIENLRVANENDAEAIQLFREAHEVLVAENDKLRHALAEVRLTNGKVFDHNVNMAYLVKRLEDNKKVVDGRLREKRRECRELKVRIKSLKDELHAAPWRDAKTGLFFVAGVIGLSVAATLAIVL